MKFSLILSILSIYTLATVRGEDFIVGNVSNGVQLAKHEEVKYEALLFVRRINHYFYSGPDNKKIQGIQALDTDHSSSLVTITEGGLGHSFVKLRMKSDVGKGLSYDISIFVQPDN